MKETSLAVNYRWKERKDKRFCLERVIRLWKPSNETVRFLLLGGFLYAMQVLYLLLDFAQSLAGLVFLPVNVTKCWLLRCGANVRQMHRWDKRECCKIVWVVLYCGDDKQACHRLNSFLYCTWLSTTSNTKQPNSGANRAAAKTVHRLRTRSYK